MAWLSKAHTGHSQPHCSYYGNSCRKCAQKWGLGCWGASKNQVFDPQGAKRTPLFGFCLKGPGRIPPGCLGTSHTLIICILGSWFCSLLLFGTYFFEAVSSSFPITYQGAHLPLENLSRSPTPKFWPIQSLTGSLTGKSLNLNNQIYKMDPVITHALPINIVVRPKWNHLWK